MGRVLCYHPPMPTVYELALIVGTAVGGSTLASVATRYIHRPEVSTGRHAPTDHRPRRRRRGAGAVSHRPHVASALVRGAGDSRTA